MENDEMSRTARHNKDTAKEEKKEKKAKTKKEKKPKKKKTKRGIFLRIFLGLVLAACLAFLAGVALFWSYAKDAPAISDDKLDATVSSKVYAANGDLIEDIGSEKREKVTPSEVPQLLEDAIISVEDRRFYDHIGVDPVRIVGSAVSNVKTGGLQGGSTLTQQLIKLSYFSTNAEDQTLERKAQEAWMAIQLEKEKSKQEILTYYINKVYMANGLYGMGTAAKVYYGKELADLTLPEAALIAGLPQAPSAYDPYAYPEAAKERRDTVLYTMLDNDKITQEEYDEAVAVPIDEGLQSLDNTSDNWKLVDNYITQIDKEVSEKTGKDIYTDGLEIYTNIDMDAQKRLYDIVNTNQYVTTYPDDDLQIAVTVIDVNTGQVKAQIGGRKIADDVRLGTNLAVNTTRDFGSTMKPLTDYGPAFEYLQKSSGDYITDEPYNYPGTSTAVNNWDNSYLGTITLRKALYESRNVPAVKLLDEVGTDQASEFLKGLGIEYSSFNYSNAISSNDEKSSEEQEDGTQYGVSTEKSAAAYAAFANGGTYYEPQYVSKVVYQDGKEEDFTVEGTKAMSESTAYMVTDILKDVTVYGTAQSANIDGLYQAGKSGTSNYTEEQRAQIDVASWELISPDVLYTGYTKNYVIAVWAGYNNPLQPILPEFNDIAQQVYRQMMQYMASTTENTDWEMPDDLIRVGNELYYADSYSTQPSYSYTVPSSTVEVPESTEPVYSEPAATSSSSEELPASSEEPTTPSSESTPSSSPAEGGESSDVQQPENDDGS